ncbi:MAG: DNA cytosine methyltransferase [Lentisphaeraceae bacterium]|nr:DNA cytosine methyltransferase [Lentisphaeraceae bacterium]
MAFEQAGFEIVYSNEIDRDFANFYKEGMSSWSGESKEISEINDIRNTSSEKIKRLIKGTFGIIGGPPCQDFSTQGSKNGFDGIRGTLTHSYYQKITELKPDFFLMENVPGLVLLKKTKKGFNQILELFRHEYNISVTRLNSLHYGLPQSRERLFVFGIRKSGKKYDKLQRNIWPIPTYPNAENLFRWGEPKERALIKSTTDLPLPPAELCINRILIKNSEMKKIPNSQEFFKIRNIVKVNKILEGDTYRPSFKRLHRNKYSPTACYGNNEVHLHPIKNRRLSVREALRIQGVPDSYILNSEGMLTKKFKMIGNGVPVPLVYEIAMSIKKLLCKLEKMKKKSLLKETCVRN